MLMLNPVSRQTNIISRMFPDCPDPLFGKSLMGMLLSKHSGYKPRAARLPCLRGGEAGRMLPLHLIFVAFRHHLLQLPIARLTAVRDIGCPASSSCSN